MWSRTSASKMPMEEREELARLNQLRSDNYPIKFENNGVTACRDCPTAPHCRALRPAFSPNARLIAHLDSCRRDCSGTMPFAPICTAAQVPIKLLALGPAGAELALSMPPVRRTKYSTSAEQYAVYERVVRFPIRRPLEVSNQASRADSWLDLTDGFGAPCQTSSSTALGRFSDVYRSHHRDIGAVAVKRLRYTRRDESLHVRSGPSTAVCCSPLALQKKMLAKEGAVLKQPRHEYILPFFGYCVPMDSLCIVTLWADHGSLRSYLMRYPFADRLLLVGPPAVPRE